MSAKSPTEEPPLKMTSLRVDSQVREAIEKEAVGFETINDVVRRIMKLERLPSRRQNHRRGGRKHPRKK